MPSRSSRVRRLSRSARATASILNQDLPLPEGPIRRIAVIGDTGCRVNDWEKKYQACNDPEAWPFAQVAQAVADWDPDLIVHVGDYLYRESPCPEGMAGCQGNPHGDNWATWDADFFTPAASAPRRRALDLHARQSRDLRSQSGRMVHLPRPAALPSRLSAVYRALRHDTAWRLVRGHRLRRGRRYVRYSGRDSGVRTPV